MGSSSSDKLLGSAVAESGVAFDIVYHLSPSDRVSVIPYTSCLSKFVIMTAAAPDLLFRCCSSTSVGRLDSGKFKLRANRITLRNEELLSEFCVHSRPWEATQTALVSTTINCLRVFHLAFNKLFEGEDADQIELVFIMPDLDASVKLHCAEDIASQLHWPEEHGRLYRREYLFEWHIPESVIVHRITMDTLLCRGFGLQRLCGRTTFEDFPKFLDFQNLIRSHWKGVCLFDRGYKAAAAACLFGHHSLTGRLADEMLGLTSNRYPYGRVREGIEDAFESYASSIGDGLMVYKVELEDLSQAVALLDHEHVIEVEKIQCRHRDQTDDVERVMIMLEKQHQSHRAALETRLADIHLDIGY